MSDQRIQEYSKKFLAGTINQSEWLELRTYILSHGGHPEFELEMQEAFEEQQYPVADARIFDRVIKNILDAESSVKVVQKPFGNRYMWKWRWAAAIIVFTLGIALFYLLKSPVVPKHDFTKYEEVSPGKEGAILTLANGKAISLDTISDGPIAIQDGIVARVSNGRLFYEGHGEKSVLNTMSTPRGRQFQLSLPDGTKVWLNAASSIRFPTAFKGNQRKVEVTGEAYLEVVKNAKMPFSVVLKDRSEVKVLGTSFNINAYENEESIKTTLLDGAVEVSAREEKMRLVPGQQAQVSKDGIRKVNADVSQVIAWKNGLFDFTGKDVKIALREIARWYDLEIVYEGEAPAGEIVGKMQMNLALPQVLNILKGLDIKYKIEGRRIFITQ
jgi:transmembrane sensor